MEDEERKEEGKKVGRLSRMHVSQRKQQNKRKKFFLTKNVAHIKTMDLQSRLNIVKERIADLTECRICVTSYSVNNYSVACENHHMHCINCHRARNKAISTF